MDWFRRRSGQSASAINKSYQHIHSSNIARVSIVISSGRSYEIDQHPTPHFTSIVYLNKIDLEQERHVWPIHFFGQIIVYIYGFIHLVLRKSIRALLVPFSSIAIG